MANVKYPPLEDIVEECRQNEPSSVPCEEDADHGKELIVTWIRQGVSDFDFKNEDLYYSLDDENAAKAEKIVEAMSHSNPTDHLDLDMMPMDLLFLLCHRLYEGRPDDRPWMQHGTMSDLAKAIEVWGGLPDGTHTNAQLINYLTSGFKIGFDFDEHLFVRWPTVRNVADIATWKSVLPDPARTDEHFHWLLQVAVTNLWRNFDKTPWGDEIIVNGGQDVEEAKSYRNTQTQEFLTEWGDKAPGPAETRATLYQLYITGKLDEKLIDISGQKEDSGGKFTVHKMKNARWSKTDITKERWRFIVGFMYKDRTVDKPWPAWTSTVEEQARLLAAQTGLTEVKHRHLLKHHMSSLEKNSYINSHTHMIG
jgi:hypothetical protein